MASEFHTTRRIEFCDTDMAGIVHFSRFFLFMESAEHEFLRAQGLSVQSEGPQGIIGWPRVAASCEYRAPARFDEELEVHVQVVRMKRKSITYRITFRRGEVVVAEGTVTAACCQCTPGTPLQAVPIPQAFTDRIQAVPDPAAG